MFVKLMTYWSNQSASSKIKLKIFAGLIVLILLIILGVVIVYQLYAPDSETSEEFHADDGLLFAQTLCRHGDRTILQSYPNDPWQGAEFWPMGYFQLTNNGKKQHFELGKYLRKRYAKLLENGSFSANKVYVWSSDTDRTLMSAQATLAGLFPPSDNQIWNKNINWQPIPVHTEPRSLDYRLANAAPCDHFDSVMYREWQNSTEYKELFQKNQRLIEYLEVNSGQNLKSLSNLTYLADTLHVEQSMGFRLPSWAQEKINDAEWELLILRWFAEWTETTEMKKIRAGFLLKEIFDRFVNKSQSTLSPDRSLWMYFGHDFTIANVLRSLDMYTPHIPPTASCLFFELIQSEDSSNPYVQIFYKKSTESTIPELEIPKCGLKCPLNKLYELYDDILPKQSHEEECKLRVGETLPPGGNKEIFDLEPPTIIMESN